MSVSKLFSMVRALVKFGVYTAVERLVHGNFIGTRFVRVRLAHVESVLAFRASKILLVDIWQCFFVQNRR